MLVSNLPVLGPILGPRHLAQDRLAVRSVDRAPSLASPGDALPVLGVDSGRPVPSMGSPLPATPFLVSIGNEVSPLVCLKSDISSRESQCFTGEPVLCDGRAVISCEDSGLIVSDNDLNVAVCEEIVGMERAGVGRKAIIRVVSRDSLASTASPPVDLGLGRLDSVMSHASSSPICSTVPAPVTNDKPSLSAGVVLPSSGSVPIDLVSASDDLVSGAGCGVLSGSVSAICGFGPSVDQKSVSCVSGLEVDEGAVGFGSDLGVVGGSIGCSSFSGSELGANSGSVSVVFESGLLGFI